MPWWHGLDHSSPQTGAAQSAAEAAFARRAGIPAALPYAFCNACQSAVRHGGEAEHVLVRELEMGIPHGGGELDGRGVCDQLLLVLIELSRASTFRRSADRDHRQRRPVVQAAVLGVDLVRANRRGLAEP